MFVPQQSPLNYYRVHNAYQLKSACSRNQNSKASIKWKMRNGHKIIQRNIKGFRGFGLEALRLFYRIPCSKKRFDSAFRFPTIPRWSSGRLLHAGTSVSGGAALPSRLPVELTLDYKSVHMGRDHCNHGAAEVCTPSS